MAPIIRTLSLTVVLAAASVADAANYDPRIAWTSYEGKGDTIYVANADGTLKVAVYKTNKTTITGLDLGAGRIAFTEGGVLKTFTWTATANGVVATAPVVLDATGAPYQGASAPDLSPDGRHLIYLRWIQDPVTGSAGHRELRVIPVDGSAPPKVLVSTSVMPGTRYMLSPRWLSDSEFAFGHSQATNLVTLRLASLDAAFDLTASPLVLFQTDDPAFRALGVWGFDDFDISHTGPSVLIAGNPLAGGSVRTFVQYDYVAHTFTPRLVVAGRMVHFQAGDASIVYGYTSDGVGVIAGNVRRWVAATNTSTVISGKGAQTIRFTSARP